MAVNIKNVFIGVLCAGAIFLGLFAFVFEWADDLDVSISQDLHEIQQEVNTTSSVMYAQAEVDEEIIDDSNVYGGAADLGVISSEAYTALKNTFKMTKIVSKTMTQINRLKPDLVPQWAFDLALTAFIATLSFLVLAAIFRASRGIV